MIDVTFQPDETGQQIRIVVAPIRIVDDFINEASEQDFVVTLDIFSATDISGITISLKDSLCRIIDNDGELFSTTIYSHNSQTKSVVQYDNNIIK